MASSINRLTNRRCNQWIAVLLFALWIGHTSERSPAQETRQSGRRIVQTYSVQGRTASEVRRMLQELLGQNAISTEIVADESAGQIKVSGTAAVQTLAKQLVEQLNADAGPAPEELDTLELQTYRADPALAESLADALRQRLSASARISLDRTRQQLMVFATPADQQLAAQIIVSSQSDRPSTDLRLNARLQNNTLTVSDPTYNPLDEESGPTHRQANSDQQTASQSPVISQQDDFWTDRRSERSPSVRSPAERSQSGRSQSGRSTSLNQTFDNTSQSDPPSQKSNPIQRASGTIKFRAIAFDAISATQAEAAIRRIFGNRLTRLEDHRYRYSTPDRRLVELSFDLESAECHVAGAEELMTQFETLLHQLDQAGQKQNDKIRIVPLNNVDPTVLDHALLLWKTAGQPRPVLDGPAPTPDSPAPNGPVQNGAAPKLQGSVRSPNSLIRRAGFQQIPGEPSIPIVSTDESQLNDGLDDQATRGSLRRPSSDVTVEPLPDLDVLILRGRDPDVEELARIIQEIERLSEETAPEIEIVYLHHVQGEALEDLISDVLTDLTGPLQGRVSITPLVKPNALLLIGWGEAVAAAKRLIVRLDETVEPQTQMQMFSLKHAAVNQVADTVEEFLNGRGGLGPSVNVSADGRTNTLIVNAAPRDLLEIRKLVERLDASTSESVNQARIIQLKNALAADVSQTITQAITAARGGTGTSRSAALEMLMAGPDGKQIVASGLLDDVRLTPDVRTNRIFITGPPETVPLIEHMIRSFDESPAASAQIKVFQVMNGDATDLVQVLRSLFPEQAVTSTVPQLSTSDGEGTLVPVRFSVDVRTNSIIATGTAGDLRIIEVLLMRLDESDSQERVNEVYRLKNSPALDVANAVNNFLRSERVVNQAAPGRQNPFAQIESEVVVVPEPVGNALIISATPRYFEQILELVEGLDAQPPQVMIQVILAEVELDNLHEFGVELGLQDSLLFDRSLLGSILTPGYDFNNRPLGNANTAQSLATQGKVGGQALSHFSLGRTSTDTDFGGLVLSASSENVSVLLRAMNQSRSMEILSRPQIMTLDNQPAFIQVGQRVPRIVGTSINQVGQVNSVELENVGLILGVTPRISPEGMVVMEIDAEKSDVGLEIDGIPVSVSADGSVIRSPRVNITTAQTTVSSASGQTIVIGGLITTNNTTTARRVPWLSDVPLVGNLFRFDSNANTRKELLIILTPHVVRGQSDAEYLKQVEMARMSWISCDVFQWMNTDPIVTGEPGTELIPTVFPDETPGITSMQRSLSESLATLPTPTRSRTNNVPRVDGTEVRTAGFVEQPGNDSNQPAGASSRQLPTQIVVPEWKIERADDQANDVNSPLDSSEFDSPPFDSPTIQQLSYQRSSAERATVERVSPARTSAARTFPERKFPDQTASLSGNFDDETEVSDRPEQLGRRGRNPIQTQSRPAEKPSGNKIAPSSDKDRSETTVDGSKESKDKEPASKKVRRSFWKF